MPTEAQDWPMEPWERDDACPTECIDADGNWIEIYAPTALRIVLCVNACQGLSNDVLDRMLPGEIKRMMQDLAESDE